MTLRGRFLVAAALIVPLVSGCMQVAKVFLDLPEAQPTRAGALSGGLGDSLTILPVEPELPPPPIEALTDPDSVLALLPSDHAGVVDWEAAAREEIIRPRPGARGEEDAVTDFGFDAYLDHGEGPDAFFPHSSHQRWLSCESCHPRVYRSGSDSFDRETAHEAESCAYCHSGIAFPIQSCERCHEEADDLPEQRFTKTLGGVSQLERDPSGRGRATRAEEDLNLVTSYPPAIFPHGPHRVRFQCRACHEDPFPMITGGTVLTEDEAHGGGACGSCHDGIVAFETGADECYRCHAESAEDGLSR